MAERDQALLEGRIGESGWNYRTARMPGHLDFVSPDDEVQSVEGAGAAIIEVRPLHDPEDRELLVLTDKTERIYRRGDDEIWREEGMRLRG